MAKHPHKLLLINKKTWKCMLEGCNFFVHRGLEHVLVGKQVICWACLEQFLFNYESLREDKPQCTLCKTGVDGHISLDEMEKIIEDQLARAKANPQPIEQDEVEMSEQHTASCDINFGGDCTCM